MRRQDFHYQLPPARIARDPIEPRSAARLLHLAGEGIRDRVMLDLPGLMTPGDLLVFNDTRVIKARLRGRKPSGGKAELLIERVLAGDEVLAQLGVSKKPRPGGRLRVADGEFELLDRDADLFRLRWLGPGDVWSLMERAGELPLPPYFERPADAHDETRYQTLFADKPGAVAAPTASLHFDPPLLAALSERGVRFAKVTLHVGAGTFQPVRVEALNEHRMHSERYEVSAETVGQIEETRARGGRVTAVGTTVCRALESASSSGILQPGCGETRLFITPGYRFSVFDRLLTNFHLPESTLLMLVSAFGGHARVMQAYQHAISAGYRFYSYGDAMLIEPQPV